MLLNEDGPVNTTGGESAWNNVFPTSTEFTAGFNVNANGAEYVAYLFAHDDRDEGVIQCGSYSGTGNPNTIDLGWEPQYLLIKAADYSGDWHIVDCMRGAPTGGNTVFSYANNNSSEIKDSHILDLNPTGFTVNNTLNPWNQAGRKYIYMAIRRSNKPAEDCNPLELYNAVIGGKSDPGYEIGKVDINMYNHPVDFAFWTTPTGNENQLASSRLIQDTYLRINTNSSAAPSADYKFDYSQGWYDKTTLVTTQSWMWKRAMGFFDTVVYEGYGDLQLPIDIAHNLGVVPEMMWVKQTTSTKSWYVYHKSMGNGAWLSLDKNDAIETGNTSGSSYGPWNQTTPTELEFTVAGHNSQDDDYIAYLWASVPGFCDIGTYTGTGSGRISIDCGFTTGARFVMVKRTDSSSHWMARDTLRGDTWTMILNDTVAHLQGLRIPDYSPGFQVQYNDDNGVLWNPNADGAEYIYMAIA
jgi:hypothetical protein